MWLEGGREDKLKEVQKFDFFVRVKSWECSGVHSPSDGSKEKKNFTSGKFFTIYLLKEPFCHYCCNHLVLKRLEEVLKYKVVGLVRALTVSFVQEGSG